MALSATVVFEVRATGNDTNGGGFSTGASGTDFSQQDSPQYSATNGVTNGTTTITSATASFGTDVVGNLIYVQGGTGSIVAGWYQIISRTNATTIVVDRSTGLTSGTGVTLRIGGALASPGKVAQLATVSGHKVWIRTGTYTLTTTTAGPAGPVVFTNSVSLEIEGYQTTRGDLGTPPEINAGALSNITVWKNGGYYAVTQKISNILVNGNSRPNIIAFDSAQADGDNWYDCVAKNAVTGFKGAFAINCIADTCTTGFLTMQYCHACEAKNNTTGFSFSTSSRAVRCIARANSGVGYTTNGAGSIFVSCDAIANGSHGFQTTNYANVSFVDCVATGNSGWGFDDSSLGVIYTNCAAHNNFLGNRKSTATAKVLIAFTVLTSDPWTSTTDFRPNDASGGGLSLRTNAVMPSSQSSALDRGAVQHSDSGGGGSVPVPYGYVS